MFPLRRAWIQQLAQWSEFELTCWCSAAFVEQDFRWHILGVRRQFSILQSPGDKLKCVGLTVEVDLYAANVQPVLSLYNETMKQLPELRSAEYTMEVAIR